jgi:hypothetical protein
MQLSLCKIIELKRIYLFYCTLFVVLLSCSTPKGFEYKGLNNVKVNNVGFEYLDLSLNLVYFNPNNFKVDFKVLDITKDELPEGDLVFIRQVFQHLSNDQIIKVLPKIILKYKYLVLTEHLPKSTNFLHNLDMPTGPGTRNSLANGASGVVLTSSPFNLKPIKTDCLCDVSEDGGVLRTVFYQLN